MITDYTFYQDPPPRNATLEDLIDEEPLWCGGCNSAEDPCDCYTRAFNAVDELGVPFRPSEGAIYAALLDICYVER